MWINYFLVGLPSKAKYLWVPLLYRCQKVETIIGFKETDSIKFSRKGI